jgi:uncharacterized membrane protein YkvA (DUF1232 family)/DNA-binding Xre family transcriptional regulator
MSEVQDNNHLGSMLKRLLKDQSLSMRKLSALTDIDTATISRIVNGKRKATPEHLRKFADNLGISMTELFAAAGFPIKNSSADKKAGLSTSVESIQNILEASSLYDKRFTIASVEQQLTYYQQYGQTEEGKESILNSFEDKLQKVNSIGPFINQLKDMYERFRLKKGTPRELMLLGGVLLYFILPVDVIPDYIFPVGYLDDAMAVQIVADLLSKSE